MRMKSFSDGRCLGHRAPSGYPERPERLTGILERLRDGSVALEEGCTHPRAREAVARLHDPAYVARFEAAVARGDALLDSADNPLSEKTAEAAWAAVECVLAAADWAVGGARRAAFAAVRPPGHHAEEALAMGFCYFNNVAVAAGQLLAAGGLSRVAIFDFDVHHGNGTQHLFEARDDVLFVSVHQYPFYPGTGAASEIGRGGGRGFTVNIPLEAGCGDAEYLEAVRKQVVPALVEFQPQALLYSAGFDAWRNDPLGGMQLTEEGFRRLTAETVEAAGTVGCHRVVSCLEGGYDLAALPRLVAAHLEGLADGA